MTPITIQVFQNGEPVGEYRANVPVETETAAVDYVLSRARIDLRYRFLGRDGIVLPSDPHDYMLYQGR